MNALFVYGTLAPGKDNFHRLEHLGGTWVKASVNGRLINEGWGSAHGCPGIIPDPEASPVHGFLLISDNLPDFWTELDEFEGSDYRRTLVEVTTAHGETSQAYIYAIRTATRG